MTKSPSLDDLTIDLAAAISGGATIAMADLKTETTSTPPPDKAETTATFNEKLVEKWKNTGLLDALTPERARRTAADMLRDPSPEAMEDARDSHEQEKLEEKGVTNRDIFEGGVNKAIDGVEAMPRPTTLEGMVERYYGHEIDYGDHLQVLERMLQQHTLNEWAVRCWSGMKHYEDPHIRLVEMLKTREWSLRELAKIEAAMDDYHPIDRRSPAASLNTLLNNPPHMMEGVQQLTELMNRYSGMAGENEKHRRLPFFARASLFIKKALGLQYKDPKSLPPRHPTVEQQLENIQDDYVAPASTAADRYRRLLDGLTEDATREMTYEFADDLSEDLINEQMREFRKKLGIPHDEE